MNHHEYEQWIALLEKLLQEANSKIKEYEDILKVFNDRLEILIERNRQGKDGGKNEDTF